MAVIAQCAGYWDLCTIAEQRRQKSTKRAAEKRNARARAKRGLRRKNNVEVTESDALLPAVSDILVSKHLNIEGEINENNGTSHKLQDFQMAKNEIKFSIFCKRMCQESVTLAKRRAERNEERFSMAAEAVDQIPDVEMSHERANANIEDNTPSQNDYPEISDSFTRNDCVVPITRRKSSSLKGNENAGNGCQNIENAATISVLGTLSADQIKAIQSKMTKCGKIGNKEFKSVAKGLEKTKRVSKEVGNGKKHRENEAEQPRVGRMVGIQEQLNLVAKRQKSNKKVSY